MEKPTELKKKIRRLKIPGFIKTSDLCEWIEENIDVSKTSKLTFEAGNVEIVEWEDDSLSDEIFVQQDKAERKVIIAEKVKEAIKRLKCDLVEVERRYLLLRTKAHFVDHDYHTWNCPADGIDYALHKIDKYMGPKLT